MTLGDFFENATSQPTYLIAGLCIVPFLAFLSLLFGKDKGHLSPLKYLYSILVYLASVPGIFAITLSVYLFLFERKSIMDTNVYTQILPVLSMILTLWLIKKNVALADVPGFNKISQLISIISILICMMWLLEKTRIFVFTYMPFYQFILLFVGFLILIRYFWAKMIK